MAGLRHGSIGRPRQAAAQSRMWTTLQHPCRLLSQIQVSPITSFRRWLPSW